ncbi:MULTISPECIES: bifunctional ADP-dependent NAD(P)H-hydrate dehydratase/NAD(P)H-hydrate epimerase [unclassified Ensifer]|uniref:bifunctional ADP-dependent NAD(P)H-hydrate dehydratase/NAD(P)H-hydrate epimerase n=1 Tax=unclassified Ensifer TaxID=2633371 RepID=UPI000813A183|nr:MULTISPECIES: bifunctional ADP-dependent NAD(P)H-hydrate dehydratase/NAD(P)H-hydrate epimerase [unclassified Ensifer]OCP01016.1 bifunctional ADP-dependent (S)-NAD(P)H-hydrate dehydratase/NAD(P)H-hydrate epimerase [Ensifer sp. LC11]OCP01589.1 bifunctional ADP-dependent (S)-NAD(P)H-hydrate dehydratase/NAD(P)H-hydrate epimerase [Ensifer sp. LC13]OCP02137.1 bifunctional ADP-dependent (S)-NAD(P)H-hydrate dehydratase/NAD(P)H-hydrate epimerase [Ensifer sp. LC14]OCP30031.1 bifunctional ADP-dependent
MRSELQHLLITPSEMTAIDRAAAQSGIDGFMLMRNAGLAVTAAALRHFPGAHRFVVLCGPGNNGGDGYLAARGLSESGADVTVFALGDPGALQGDAARARSEWDGPVAPLTAFGPQAGDVVVDALFGAGLSRDLTDDVVHLIERVNASGVPVLAIDLPSGIDGRTGQIRGAAFFARHTVTFMTPKPGHWLLPGRSLCGTLEVFDIGIPSRIVRAGAGSLRLNTPAVWAGWSGDLAASTHKFKRGHLVVFSGDRQATGAARLSAAAGLAAGAGLVTVATGKAALGINASQLTAVMVKEVDGKRDLTKWLRDHRLGSFVLGPGFGVGKKARDFALAVCDRALVLDADGITSFQANPDELFAALACRGGQTVLTPHEGEFVRLFPEIAGDQALSKIEKAQQAAQLSHAVIVYKGADTVVAAPDGRAVVNGNAPPWLATAGSGDVLAGITGAHLAQGMPAFEAAAAAVWRHGAAGNNAGPGLTAETLIRVIPPLA